MNKIIRTNKINRTNRTINQDMVRYSNRNFTEVKI